MNNFKDFIEAYSVLKICKIVLKYTYPKIFSTDFIFRNKKIKQKYPPSHIVRKSRNMNRAK